MPRTSGLYLPRCGVAVAALTVAVPLTCLMASLRHHPVSLFLIAVVVSAWVGLREALVALLLAVLALGLFFLPPLASLEAGVEDIVRLGVFLLAGGFIVALTAVSRQREAAARQQDRRKDELLAILAHELRTPLSSLAYSLEAFRRDGADGEQLGQARAVMGRQLRAMTRLVEDLEDAAAVRQGKLQLRCAAVDVARAVAHAVESTRALFEEKGHKLLVALSPGPLPLWADADRLGQVLVNLLKNAARYTDAGGRVTLAVSREDGDAVLRVRDTGVGFEPALAPQLFDLFVQVSGARGGLGVGLSLVRSIVELHGGSVTAASAGPGRGSEFVVRLPLAEAGQVAGPAAFPCRGKRRGDKAPPPS